MLTFNIKAIFEARGIERPFTLLVKAGIQPNAAHNLLSAQIVSMRLSHMEKICTILNCTPNDLLVWTPNKNETIPKTHPLASLKKKNIDLNWRDTIENIPLNQLQQIVTIIKKHKPAKKSVIQKSNKKALLNVH
jgi:DNA-binding Xre family transcriptional regulator